MGARRQGQGGICTPLENLKARFTSITTFYFTKRTKIVVTKHVSLVRNAFVGRVPPWNSLRELTALTPQTL